MKRGRKMLVLLSGSLALCAAATARTAAAADNPYQGIVERNVFGLKPPPPPPNPEDNKPPPPKIFLTGITTILGNKRALMKTTPPVTKPGEQPKEQSFTLAEGEREGGLEVLEIDEKAGTVKVNNYGTVTTIDFESNGVKAPTAPAPAPGAVPMPGAPPAMRPGMPMPGGMPGATPMPNRQLRVPPGAGASVTPQASAGAGLASVNAGINPTVMPNAGAAQNNPAPDPETSLMMLELNRIAYQPLVEAGQWPALPPGSEEMRAAILGPEPGATPTAAPTRVMPPLPPGGPQPFPPQATQ